MIFEEVEEVKKRTENVDRMTRLMDVRKIKKLEKLRTWLRICKSEEMFGTNIFFRETLLYFFQFPSFTFQSNICKSITLRT